MPKALRLYPGGTAMQPSTNIALTVQKLVEQIKGAVAHVEEDQTIKVTALELELKTTLEANGSGGFQLGPVKIGGSAGGKNIQTLSIKLIPEVIEDHGVTPESLKDDLIRAINAIKIAINEAQSAEPVFGLQVATVTFNFAIAADGGFEVIAFKAGIKAEELHTITLTLTAA
jgi:hypothetical protein